MIFHINVFGAKCKACDKPFTKEEFISGKLYMKIGHTGELIRSTGYLDLFHKGCG